jgi:hypothetical protein
VGSPAGSLTYSLVYVGRQYSSKPVGHFPGQGASYFGPAVALVFLVVIPEEPALSEVEWGTCCCICRRPIPHRSGGIYSRS